MAAPAKPPIRVCEEEDGIPFHQVTRFQVIAAITPANIMGRDILLYHSLGYCIGDTESTYYIFGNEKGYEIEESSP